MVNDKLGHYKIIEAKLNLKLEATPTFCRAHPLPLTLKPKVEALTTTTVLAHFDPNK